MNVSPHHTPVLLIRALHLSSALLFESYYLTLVITQIYHDRHSLTLITFQVTFFENGTYPTNATAPKFTATWQYPRGPETQPVHAFPNAKILLPEILDAPTVQLSNLSSLPVDLAWTYGSGYAVAQAADAQDLDAAGMNANICFDMFLDPDEAKAQTTNVSAVEVMIWFGNYGLSTQPIGYLQGVVATQKVNQTSFSLYDGENASTKQKVFTWLAEGNTTDFTGDIAPLIQQLVTYGGPTSSDHLGYIAFGSEALLSTSTVTFSVSELSVDVVTR